MVTRQTGHADRCWSVWCVQVWVPVNVISESVMGVSIGFWSSLLTAPEARHLSARLGTLDEIDAGVRVLLLVLAQGSQRASYRLYLAPGYGETIAYCQGAERILRRRFGRRERDIF